MDSTALFTMTYGMYILATKHEDKHNACIINTAIQVTQDPMRISVTVLKSNFTHDLVMASGQLSLSVLSEMASLELITRFGFQSGRDVDKFQEFDYSVDTLGNPVVETGCLATMSAKVIQSIDLGTHTLFIADVIDAKTITSGKPMSYAYYRDLKTGKVKQAQDVVAEEPTSTISNQDIYQCSICHYVYDGETPFEALPDDYVCPLCNQPKSVFTKHN